MSPLERDALPGAALDPAIARLRDRISQKEFARDVPLSHEFARSIADILERARDALLAQDAPAARIAQAAPADKPRNRAAEWGEYMAKGGENLLISINELHEAEESEDGERIADKTELLGEMMTGLRSDIHEFRKRVAQDAALSAAPAEPSQDREDAALLALERITHSYRLLLAGKPVRDVAETLAEADADLAARQAPKEQTP